MDEHRFSRPHENDLISRIAALRSLGGSPLVWTGSDYEIGMQRQWGRDFDAIKSVPSAQSEPLSINLNEWIKVKLTDLGKEIYYHRYDKLNKTYGREVLKPSLPSEDEDGYTRFQLWKFIQLYGAHIGMGAPNVIDPLEIVYGGEINARTD